LVTLFATPPSVFVVSSQYLSVSDSAAHAQLLEAGGASRRAVTATPHAAACSEEAGASSTAALLASPDACYVASSKSYVREWRLWEDVSVRGEASWPAAINEEEESVHAKRFDGILPLLQQQEADQQAAGLKASTAAAGQEAAAEAAEAAAEAADETIVPNVDGEGGRKRRRATDVHGNLEADVDMGDDAETTDDATTSSEEAAFTITATNSYTKKKSVSSEYAWSYVVEPYRTTTLAVVDPAEGSSYEWTVDGHIQGYGASVEVVFMEIGYHVVKIQELVAVASSSSSSNGSRKYRRSLLPMGSDSAVSTGGDDAAAVAGVTVATSNKVVVKLMSKYVRREVRGLTDADREAWLSAVQVMQRVPTHTGQAL
jgi:hypothetical protein